MRLMPSGTGFSATDLSAFLACRHRTLLELGVLAGELERPGENDVERRLLEIRGSEHEQRVLERYRAAGLDVVAIGAEPGAEGAARARDATLAAMSAGASVIYQAALAHGDWSGRPDFLVKVGADGGARSGRWAHHYEVVDAKLAREATARAVLQLCVYTDHLSALQGVEPRHFHVAVGGSSATPIALLAADYMAYYRAIRAEFECFVEASGGRSAERPYPEPVEHCGVCRFWRRCEDQRRLDDHLSLVANITRRQRDRLAAAGVTSLAALAALDAERAVDGVPPESLARLRAQAALQWRGRSEGRAIYELLRDAEPGTGLERLPAPTPGDLFLDLEGDAFVRGQGLEYLFGLVDFGEPELDFTVRDAPSDPRYHAFWAHDAPSEKRAFEALIDRIRLGREEFANLHVFHFGHRESDALKRLSCRHKTREAEVDALLRDRVLVDLYPIVRHALRASVESYSLKELEALHGFRRSHGLRDAALAMLLFGFWLETGASELDPDDLRQRIQAYNRDDCLSTARLRDFLEGRRAELAGLTGKQPARPSTERGAENEERSAKNQATIELARRLTAGLPSDRALDGEAERARRLMADLIEWHWREAKSGWWEYFRARDLAPDDRLDDRAVLGSLRHEGVVDKVKKSLVHRYAFPAQEHAIRRVPTPIDPRTEKTAGTVLELGAQHLHLKRGASSSVEHPSALIPGRPIDTDPQERSLFALGEALAAGGAALPAPFRAASELLARALPRGAGGAGSALVPQGEPVPRALARLALGLDGSVLAVQGPPGSGKTHQAALMILELLRAGKRVGVTANSHEVIKNLLRKVAELAAGADVRALHLEEDDGADGAAREPFEVDNDKPRAARRLAARELNLVGGTAWPWASEAFASSVDVLVIDEAGQISLANALAVARAAKSLVLFGDPAQLEQPQKGVHPPGADVSALEHLLGPDAVTLPPERGVFLPHTRRLHPGICDFVSEVFYEGRLSPEADLGLEHQAIAGPGVFRGSGLCFVPVSHAGNTNQSAEEVATIQALLAELLAASPTFIDRARKTRPLGEDDILVVAPYNAQVAALKRALPAGVRVGTVDKFQGKEAPIVVYSMTTSSAEDAPRGLEFLYSLNRLNVAISRAQALALLVASPALGRVACRSPRQMKLVNAFAAYLERARSAG